MQEYTIIKCVNLITTDYYGNKYEADPKDMPASIHVYGIATKDNQVLISPQFDGYDCRAERLKSVRIQYRP